MMDVCIFLFLIFIFFFCFRDFFFVLETFLFLNIFSIAVNQNYDAAVNFDQLQSRMYLCV